MTPPHRIRYSLAVPSPTDEDGTYPMSHWRFKHLTKEQAWRYVHDAETLDSLAEEAKLELAGLSAFGRSGDQREMLSSHVDPITKGGYPPGWNLQDVHNALIRLGIPEP